MLMVNVMLFLTLLLCWSCHMHHGYIITLNHLYAKFQGSSHKYVHWHLRSPWDTLMHIFRGSFSISLFTIHVFYSSLCEPKLVLSSITKKGEIESASRPLFGALKKLCAEIKWKNQEEVERKVPKFKLFCGGIHGRFNSNFWFEIEYRSTVL